MLCKQFQQVEKLSFVFIKSGDTKLDGNSVVVIISTARRLRFRTWADRVPALPSPSLRAPEHARATGNERQARLSSEGLLHSFKYLLGKRARNKGR